MSTNVAKVETETQSVEGEAIFVFLRQLKGNSFVYPSNREENTKLFVLESSQCILALYVALEHDWRHKTGCA